MSDDMQITSLLIHRAYVLKSLEAIYRYKRLMDNHTNRTDFTAGFQEGFEEALKCVATSCGFENDFARFIELNGRQQPVLLQGC